MNKRLPAALVASFLAFGHGAQAEDQAVRLHVLLPCVDGVTALSADIRARAAYLDAVGDFLEQASIARVNNAGAAEHEIRNAALWVSTYFDMRAINRAWRDKESPSHREQLKHREEVIKDSVTKYFQEALRGDVTEKLNWLLRESASRVLVLMYGRGRQSLAGRETDDSLAATDLRHIRLADAGRGGGGRVVFLADGSQVLPADWPFVLRGAEFDEARKEFEAAREAYLHDAQSETPPGFASQQRLMAAVDHLCSEFNSSYPRQRRLESASAYAPYSAGRRFLQSLAMQVFRAVNSNDRAILSGSVRFQGNTVLDLVDYMSQNGLEFASPQPGDERIYQRLFLALRAIYISLAAEDSTAGTRQD